MAGGTAPHFQAAPQDLVGHPLGAAMRALRHHGQRQLLIIVVEYLEAVVAAVAAAVEPAQQVGQFGRMGAFAGNTRRWRAVSRRSSALAMSRHMKSDSCTSAILLLGISCR